MSSKVLYSHDQLTVRADALVIGRSTIAYSSISTVSIYDGRPVLPLAIFSATALLSITLIVSVTIRGLGSAVPVRLLVGLIGPAVLFVGFAAFFRVRRLYATIDGSVVCLLSSRNLAVLAQARTAIERAKSANRSGQVSRDMSAG